VRLNVERAEDYDDLSARAARRLCEFIRAAPRGVMALPTGSTPVGTYRRTVESLRTRFLDCSGLFLVDVDEIAGLPPAHPESCAGTLRRQLLRFDPISSASCRLLDGVAADLVAEARRHERAVRDHGGLGLAVLGIGVNGHIALNEPGTPFASRAHVAELTESTVERLALSEVPDGTGPRLGLTLGIGTLERGGSSCSRAGRRRRASSTLR
jgi:glucosamine-6-phosphate deaminase